MDAIKDAGTETKGEDDGESGWLWYLGILSGIGEFFFQSSTTGLSLGEIPAAFKVRRFTKMGIEITGKDTPPLPAFQPWAAHLLGLVNPLSEGTIAGSTLVGCWPVTERAEAALNEVWRKKSGLVVPRAQLPKIDFSNLKGERPR